MGRVLVTVQITDRDRGHLGGLEGVDRCIQRRQVERSVNHALGAHTLGHAKAQMPRHQRIRGGQPHVIALVLQALAHLQHVAVPFGGQQADLGALALEQRIGRHRGAMDDALGLGKQRWHIHRHLLGQAVDRVHHPDRRVLGRTCRLGEGDGAILGNRYDVGEGTADVNSNPNHGFRLRRRWS